MISITFQLLKRHYTSLTSNYSSEQHFGEANKSLSEHNIYYTPITTPVKPVVQRPYYQPQTENRLSYGFPAVTPTNLCHPVIQYQQYPAQMQHQACRQVIPVSVFEGFGDLVIIPRFVWWRLDSIFWIEGSDKIFIWLEYSPRTSWIGAFWWFWNSLVLSVTFWDRLVQVLGSWFLLIQNRSHELSESNSLGSRLSFAVPSFIVIIV